MPRFPWTNIFGLIDWVWQRRKAQRQCRRCPIGAELLEDRVVPSAGDLDTIFGVNGISLTAMGSPASQIQKMLLQPDGKIITAGTANINTGAFTREDFGLTRVNPDGTLDPTFGSGGTVITDLGGSDRLFGVALQPDGMIVAVGRTGLSSNRWAVVRYTANGALDPTFGVGGIVVTDLQPGSNGAYDVAIQTDGKIVVVGASCPSPTISTSDFAVVRYNTDGSLDTSFGGGAGYVLTADFGRADATPNKVILQPDGDIVALGHSSSDGDNFGFAVARYEPNGSLDTTFGVNGIVKMSTGAGFSAFEDLRDAVLLPDGEIIAGGTAVTNITNRSQGTLVELTTTGQLDPTFGTNGIASVFFGTDASIQGIALDDDGNIVTVGVAVNDAWIGRFTATGSLDPSFGTSGGISTYRFDPPSQNRFSSVLILPGDRILAGGSATQFLLARFQGDGPTAPDDAYDVDEDTPLTVDAAAGVIGNDVDPQCDTLSARLITDVAHGTLILNSDGSFTYVPAANFSGTDSFTYQAFDATTTSNIAVVTITVHAVADAPTLDLSFSNAYYEGAPSKLGIDANLGDTDGSESLSILVTGLPDNVTLSAGVKNSDGSWTLTRAQEAGLTLMGPDDAVFYVTVAATATELSNGDTATTSKTSILYVQNTPPSAYVDSPALVAPPLIWDFSPAALGAYDETNDILDVQSDFHFAERILFPTATFVSGMDVYMSIDFGAIGQTGTVTFYNESAGQPGSVLTQFTATVSAVDFKGTLRGDQHRVHVDFSSPVPLLAGTPYWVSMAANSVTWTQTALEDVGHWPPGSGRATFIGETLALTNNPGFSDMAFRLYGAPAQPAGITVNEGETVNLTGSQTDPGSDTFTYAWHVQASNGQVIADGHDQGFSFVPDLEGTYTVTFTVTDDDGGIGTDVVMVTVNHIYAPNGPIPPSAGYDIPTFSWSIVANADHFSLHVVDTATDLPVINEQNLVGTIYRTPSAQALTPGHSYRWQATAYDSSGALIEDLPEISFSLASLPIPTLNGLIGLIAPADGYDMPTFAWTAAAGAHHYSLYVVDAATGLAVIDQRNIIGTAYATTAADALTPGHQYIWHVVGYSTNGQVFNQTSDRTFSLADLPAATPVGPSGIIAPSTGYDLPTFTWNAAPGANHYWLYVFDAATNQTVLSHQNLLGTSYTVTAAEALTPGHGYFWYVFDYSTNGQVFNYAPAQAFFLDNLPGPTLIGPTGVIPASDGYDMPTFHWNTSAGADHYWLYAIDTGSGQAVIDQRNLSGTSFTPDAGHALTPGRGYLWYVFAVSANGQAFGYMPPQTFSLGSLPGATLNSLNGVIAAANGYDLPTFSWNAEPAADHYWLYVVDLASSQAVIDQRNLAGTSYTTAASERLTPGRSYLWYVFDFSTNGQALGYQPGQVFSLANLPGPTAIGPSGMIPASDGYDTPTFSWNTSVGADHYWLYVVDTNTGQNVIDQRTLTGTSFTPGAAQALTPGHGFLWYVFSVSANGQAFGYLPAQTFVLANLPGPTLTGPSGILAPSDGYDLPTFTWTAAPSTQHYWLYVVDTSTNQVAINQQNLLGTSYTAVAAERLTPRHSYLWYVFGFSTNGQAYGYQPGQTFTLANLAAPMSIGLAGDIPAGPDYDMPTFRWNASVGAGHYWLYVADTASGQAVIDERDVAGTSFTPSAAQALTPGHRYIWYVFAFSVNGQAYSFSAGQTFTLANLAVPQSTTANGLIDASAGYDTPTFAWTAVAGADHYWLYVTDAIANQVVVDQRDLLTNSFTPSAAQALTPGHPFFWYVFAFSTNSQAFSYSAREIFVLAELPAPVLIGPVGNIADDTPTLTWNPVSAASRYAIYVEDVTTNQSPTDTVFTADAATTSWTPSVPLVRGHSYRWWVASVSANGSFQFGADSLDFTVNA